MRALVQCAHSRLTCKPLLLFRHRGGSEPRTQARRAQRALSCYLVFARAPLNDLPRFIKMLQAESEVGEIVVTTYITRRKP